MSAKPPRSQRRSAGLVVYRGEAEALEVLLVHPGGPLWVNRDEGAWSIPKGQYGPEEPPLHAARREFAEELGMPAPEGPVADLGEVRLRSGKLVRAWALPGDLDVTVVRSNTFELQWPPHSGHTVEVPEIDRAGWFSLPEARLKLNPAQVALIDRLQALLAQGAATQG
jgi:predicted NUDIX family NTP pyrophosphohydrolase